MSSESSRIVPKFKRDDLVWVVARKSAWATIPRSSAVVIQSEVDYSYYPEVIYSIYITGSYLTLVTGVSESRLEPREVSEDIETWFSELEGGGSDDFA